MSTPANSSTRLEPPSLPFYQRSEQRFLTALMFYQMEPSEQYLAILTFALKTVHLWLNVRVLEQEPLVSKDGSDPLDYHVAVERSINDLGHYRHWVAVMTLGDIADYCLGVGFAPHRSVKPYHTWSQGWNEEPPWWSSFLASLAWHRLAYIIEACLKSPDPEGRQIIASLSDQVRGWSKQIHKLDPRPDDPFFRGFHRLKALLSSTAPISPI